MYPYPIRLRGPWEVHVEGAAPRRVTMPALISTTQPLTLVRSFGLPRTLDDFERVWLMAERVCGLSTWWLNGNALGERGEGRCEIEVTAMLRARNELRIEFVFADAEVGFDGEIALVIRCQAYLTEVKAKWDGERIAVTGVIAGSCAEPLELYAIADDRPCGYAKGTAGERFEFDADAPSVGAVLRVDLVNKSTSWDTAMVEL